MSNSYPQAPRYRGKLQAIVLDWAGTTVDHGSLAPVRTLQRVFTEAGVGLTEPEVRRDMGLPKKEHIRGILSLQRVKREWTGLHRREPSEADVDELYTKFIPLQFSCLLEHSDVILGVVEAVERFQRRGLKIGTTTGYTREMLDLLVEYSSKAGYRPDCNVAPGDVGAGRPYPYMMYEIAVRLRVHPFAAIVKIGDTPADIHEGLNAGAWTIGVAATGNMMGLKRSEFEALSPAEREGRLALARTELYRAGAHYVVDSVAEADSVLDDIEARLESAYQRALPPPKVHNS